MSRRMRGGEQATALRRGGLDRWEGLGVGEERKKTGERQGGGWVGHRGPGWEEGLEKTVATNRQCWGSDCVRHSLQVPSHRGGQALMSWELAWGGGSQEVGTRERERR